jgi:S1-C subfamily serine protease
MKRLQALLIVIFLVQVAIAQERATTVYQQSSAAIVVVYCGDGKSFVQGSGVIITEDGLIATNYHLINGRNQAAVILKNGKIYSEVWLVAYNKTQDLALLRVKEKQLPHLALSLTFATIGETIYVISAPHGLEGTLSTGLISSIRDGEEVELLKGLRFLQFTAPISPGSSGGAILNSSGDLIGLVMAAHKDSQNLNLAVPAMYISTLAGQRSSPQLMDVLQDIPESSPAQPKQPSIYELAGSYSGSWASRQYRDADGGVIMEIQVVPPNHLTMQVSFTGSGS